LARQGASTDDVFINCPFDQAYAPIFRALIFCIYICGFRPRSARELDDSGQMRMEKLYGLIEECRYGIHDLSRTESDLESGLPRFNMPLELGLFLGAKKYGNAAQKLKRALILDVEQFRYQRFISDLAGMDIHAHGGDPARAIAETRDWVANVSRKKLASGARIARVYARFLADLPAICRQLEFEPSNLPYVDFERIALNWLLEAPVD
jgi:hypothetical protein